MKSRDCSSTPIYIHTKNLCAAGRQWRPYLKRWASRLSSGTVILWRNSFAGWPSGRLKGVVCVSSGDLRQRPRWLEKVVFDFFSTTLLFSKHQPHELVRQVGEAEAQGSSVRFLYRDFRIGWEEATRLSLEMGIYRQKYCGCVYSEAERYLGRKRMSVR